MPEAKVFRSPVDAPPQTYQAGGRDGGFAPMDVSEEMHFHAASQVETAIVRSGLELLDNPFGNDCPHLAAVLQPIGQNLVASDMGIRQAHHG